MKLLCFTVYDRAVQSYLPPFYCRSLGEAIRSFTDAVNNDEHQFAKHLMDYSLHACGEFDDVAGQFVSVEPKRVLSATECRDFSAGEIANPSGGKAPVDRDAGRRGNGGKPAQGG